VILVRKENQ